MREMPIETHSKAWGREIDYAPSGERERPTERGGDLVGDKRNRRCLVRSKGSAMRRVCGKWGFFLHNKKCFHG